MVRVSSLAGTIFMSESKQAALDYHALPGPGKIATRISKPCDSQRELSLAYTPGVAEPVRAIVADPEEAWRYTGKGNLVAVITDGSAVLGLGDTGPLAAKPVMEGKAVLFKKFAGIDVFDIEVQAATTEEFIRTVEAIAPTFGGINLEDIAAPRCFAVEEELRRRLDIPVFHDDQHGTAVIIAAGLLNALQLQGKELESVKLVCLGAGAAGIASMRLLQRLGLPRENIRLLDRRGVIHSGRGDLNDYKREFAITTDDRTLTDAMRDADVFIGVSGPGLVNADMVAGMAPKPVLFALSNPEPEIHPAAAKAVRDDLIIATGRSDYPNQVNNVLGFPFIFRGALDARAHCINDEMNIAAVRALAELARQPVPDEVRAIYPDQPLEFGPDYIIPTPFDPRLIRYVPAAVMDAAARSGVSANPPSTV